MFLFLLLLGTILRGNQMASCTYSVLRVRVMVFNTTDYSISVISWRSVLLVEESGVPTEHHRPVASHNVF